MKPVREGARERLKKNCAPEAKSRLSTRGSSFTGAVNFALLLRAPERLPGSPRARARPSLRAHETRERTLFRGSF